MIQKSIEEKDCELIINILVIKEAVSLKGFTAFFILNFVKL